MTLALIVSAGLLAASPVAPPPDLSQAYQEARARAGRSPADQIRLALWCEAHGLTTERLNHLALAVLADPTNATARGLMGLVAYGGRFQRPEAVAEKARADADLAARLAEYNARRAKAPETADGQWKLALWCEENGLKPEATAHLAAVVRLDPSREAAWKRLGCKRHDGRWLNDAAIAAEKADAETQEKADKKWRPALEKFRAALRDRGKRAEAEASLADVTDPRAVRWVWATFATGGTSSQAIAVRVLGQIDSAGASRALASLAVFAESPEARREATETIRQRDPREYAGLLIGLLRDEIKYEVRPVAGPGSPGVLFVQGRRFDVQRMYSPPPVPDHLLYLSSWAELDEYGMPVLRFYSNTFTTMRTQVLEGGFMPYHKFMHFRPNDLQLASLVAQAQRTAPGDLHRFLVNNDTNRFVASKDPNYVNDFYGYEAEKVETFRTPTQTQTTIPVGQMIVEYQKSALVAQQQLSNDITAMDRHNAGVKQSNDRVTQVLRAVSGRDHGVNRELWKKWYVDLKGYAYTSAPESPRPTVVQEVPLAYQPQMVPITQINRSVGPAVTAIQSSVTPMSTIASCFGAGTPVRTLTGPRPIESLRIGDRVLTQSTATGALGYQPIVTAYHNPPSPTFLIKLAGDTIVSSPFHRFWKAGRGWVMARDVRAGDRLRMLDGVAEVAGVEEGKVQPVFNLDVAGDADFFAGQAAALVHDNTQPDPRLAPFDAAPTPVAAARRGE